MIPNRFRKGGRIALVALYPQPDPALPPFIPNLGLYQIAAAVTASEMGDLDVRIWDETSFDLDRTVSEIEDFDPDIVGFSAYVWSLYELMKIHAEIKKNALIDSQFLGVRQHGKICWHIILLQGWHNLIYL